MENSDALFPLAPAGTPVDTGQEEEAAALQRLADAPLSRMAPDWAEALQPVEQDLRRLGAFLRTEHVSGRGFLPAAARVLRAFEQPLAGVKVLIAGQDPYPTPGHSVGLAFCTDKKTRPLPRSLANIYKELSTDLGIPPVPHGDLSPWTERGVLLLNRVMTVTPGVTGSHRGKGWETVTDAAITALTARGTPLVAILWGKDALRLRPLLGPTDIIFSAHPSPLSASRGFFGSRPFSRANQLLHQQGADPVDWALPPL
ncbi:uracil-DNA glycosylase [Paenarthrobacter sp. Z7-10]|uniref:uracil-DNA glycosylase n=1 Tax=Paenarthrobacter sp. Z7-10 TaxID=2787635 RepID=UPI003FA69DF0